VAPLVRRVQPVPYWHPHESNTTARTLYDQVAEFPGFVLYLRST
jgi:hypothetical protein